MPGKYLDFPFDKELFIQGWNEAPDPVKLAMLQSGALVEDPLIAEQLKNDGNLYTIPFYNPLGGTPVNYDGKTDITSTETTADSQTGVAYGRATGHTARNFVAELSGADPLGHISRSVGGFWNKHRQSKVIGILGGIFDIQNDADWAKHTLNIAKGSGALAKITETTLNDVMTETLGDHKELYSLAIMHSNVAKTLENLQLLEYWKHTDANGIQRPMKIGTVNGLIVIVDDGVPVDVSTTNFPKYTTYLLGMGVLRTAPGRLDVPVEIVREALKNGGQDTLVTRIRETIHPNGFSFKVP
ncbi:MAG: coat protein, partial [Bacillota bacterium]|nr:coat protein [Bacillota bacterium]